LVFQHAPLPTSPVDGGGVTAPSPPAGRVGVGAMFKSHCKDTYYHSSTLTDIGGKRCVMRSPRLLIVRTPSDLLRMLSCVAE